MVKDNLWVSIGYFLLLTSRKSFTWPDFDWFFYEQGWSHPPYRFEFVNALRILYVSYMKCVKWIEIGRGMCADSVVLHHRRRCSVLSLWTRVMHLLLLSWANYPSNKSSGIETALGVYMTMATGDSMAPLARKWWIRGTPHVLLLYA